MIGMPKVKKDTFSVFNFLTIQPPEERPPPPPPMLAITQPPGGEDIEGETSGSQGKKSSRWDQKIKLLSGAEKMTGGGTEPSMVIQLVTILRFSSWQ